MLRLLFIAVSICFYTSTWAADIEVRHAGALKNFMHKGDLSAKFSLSELKSKDHLYALGAVENLKGEIQIFDGSPAVAYAKNGEIFFDNSFSRNASLVVYTQVSEWQTFKIPKEVVTRSQFENHLKKVATKHGLNIEEPVPFLISGKTKMALFHFVWVIPSKLITPMRSPDHKMLCLA